MSELLFDKRIPERIWDKIIPEPNTGCWLWLGGLTHNTVSGYGKTSFGGNKDVSTHRLMYEQFIGPIPVSKEIDHKCRVKCCCNPAHLEAIVHQDNSRRGTAGLATKIFWENAMACKRGHPYTAETIIINKGGWRHCRVCYRMNKRWWRAGKVGKMEDYE